MSGTNKLVQSIIQGKKGGESTLTSSLMNANSVAKAQDIKGGKKVKR